MRIDWHLSQGVLAFLLLVVASGLFGCGSRSAQQADTRAAEVAALRDLHDQLTRAELG
jgi:hypothetical protein